MRLLKIFSFINNIASSVSLIYYCLGNGFEKLFNYVKYFYFNFYTI